LGGQHQVELWKQNAQRLIALGGKIAIVVNEGHESYRIQYTQMAAIVNLRWLRDFEAELTPKINPKIRDLNFTALA